MSFVNDRYGEGATNVRRLYADQAMFSGTRSAKTAGPHVDIDLRDCAVRILSKMCRYRTHILASDP